MKPFAHVDVKSVAEATRLLKASAGRARINAGGTDLLGVLRDRILSEYPDSLLNIKTIRELDYIKEEDQGLKIGAATKLAQIASSETVKGRYNLLADAAYAVATPQIRNMGTIGGNICQDVRCWYYRYPEQLGGRILCIRKGGRTCPAVAGDNRYHAILDAKKCFAVCPSDMATAIAALDGKIEITGSEGSRAVPVAEFFEPLGNVLRADEIVTHVQVPIPPEAAKQSFIKFTLRKPVDFAIASVATVVAEKNGICTDARIALGAVGYKPIRATESEAVIRGKVINEATAEEAAVAAVRGAKPLSMNGYKIQIVQNIIKRALLS
jgi:xanthine dehydrogenase YagS FAD-binding subunit